MLAERYSAALSELAWLTVPQEGAGCRHNFQSYMVRLNDGSAVGRDELMQNLLDRRHLFPARRHADPP